MNDTSKSVSADAGWTNSELERIDLGDLRLEKRLRRVAEDLSKQPEYPINVASEDMAATKAAYRLFDNEKFKADKILKCHRTKTLNRMREEPVVLAVQDTSILNYTNHKKTKGLGPIAVSQGSLQGLILHSTIAVTPYGLPLGILTHRCWSRDGFCQSNETSKDRPFVEKESFKWVEALREVSSLPTSNLTKVVHVADRECDIYEFLREAEELKASYLIRACYDRAIESEEYQSISQQIKGLLASALVTIDVPTQKRKAELELRFTHISIRTPTRIAKRNRLSIPCWIIHVIEPSPPAGCEPLSWTLLTNVAVLSAQDALERLAWYRRRWSIEEFHKILKSGCTVEDCRLQTRERLSRYLMLFCVIAWRIFWIVHISRVSPHSPAEIVLTKSEIGTICSLERFKDKGLFPSSLTVRQALIAIAALGGHLTRKSDPPPGNLAVWRGWQRLSSMTELYDSMVERCG